MPTRLPDANDPATSRDEWIRCAKEVCSDRVRTASLRTVCKIAARETDAAVSARCRRAARDAAQDLAKLDADVETIMAVARYIEREVGGVASAVFVARVVYGMTSIEAAIALGTSERVGRKLYELALAALRGSGLAKAAK